MAQKGELKEQLSEQTIAERVKELGYQITNDYKGKDLVTVSILKGSFIFTSDIVRQIELPIEVAFMALSSYGSGTVSSGRVNVKLDIDMPIKGRNVLILEDIIDSGITLYFLKDYLIEKGALSVKICTLLDKPSRRVNDMKPDYCGFVIDDYFAVGYGIDADNKYRNLKNICKLCF